MNKAHSLDTNVIDFPRAPAAWPSDQGAVSVINVLLAQLQRAREGKLRSVAIACVSADGESIETQCSCTDADVVDLVGTLNVLAREMIEATATQSTGRDRSRDESLSA